jgi:DNA-binding NtrC family response regulator
MPVTHHDSMVLLVEARKGSLATFQTLLDMQRYINCVTAGSVAELKTMLANEEVDVVVTDRSMRDANGTAMILLMRELRPGSGFVIIGRGHNVERLADVLPALHVRVLAPPVRPAEFLTTVAELMVVPST